MAISSLPLGERNSYEDAQLAAELAANHRSVQTKEQIRVTVSNNNLSSAPNLYMKDLDKNQEFHYSLNLMS